MRYPHARLLVFCKAPQAGKVKTRLASHIGDSAATEIHQFLAQRFLSQLLDFDVAPLELWCAPDSDHQFFQRCRKDLGIPLRKQAGSDLGQRMKNAMAETLSHQSPVVIVGTDCPVFTADYLQSAFAAASQNKTVIGPAEDGGYVLLGMNALQPKIFTEMPWGTSQVYAETMARLTGEVEVLPSLWDVDYVADLRRLRAAEKHVQLDKKFRAYLQGLDLS